MVFKAKSAKTGTEPSKKNAPAAQVSADPLQTSVDAPKTAEPALQNRATPGTRGRSARKNRENIRWGERAMAKRRSDPSYNRTVAATDNTEDGQQGRTVYTAGTPGSFLGRLGRISDAVMFSHTLFSLPFVLAAILLASAGRPDPLKLLWIVLASIGARNTANALNRLVDHQIDASNPRTATRALPSGRVKRTELWWFSLFMFALFVVSTAMLNLLCLTLLPVAAAFMFTYSYTKRCTWLCHYLLGFTCSMATMGGFLAISGHFELRYFVLMGAVALWVAGFDIIYARQDIAFDRSHRLHSIPERFGAQAATRIAQLSHLGTLVGFALLPLFWPLGWLYVLGLLLVFGLLVAEQILAAGNTQRHIQLASYGINQIVAVVFCMFLAFDVWLGLAFGQWNTPNTASGLLGKGIFPHSGLWARIFSTDLLAGDFFDSLGSALHGLPGIVGPR